MVLRMMRQDDITGEEDAETVTIIVNDRGIEVDLAKRSLDKLVKALEPYWAVGSEARYTVTKGGGRPSQKVSVRQQRIEEQGWDPALVRAWAAENGIEVPTRGRVPAGIVEQYQAAQ